MASEQTSRAPERWPRFTLGGTTFELLEGPEGRGDGGAVVRMTMPPDTGKFLAPAHRHPTREGVEVISGRAGVAHGYGEERATEELAAGERVHLGANEWHGIRNLSASEDLVLRLTHTPGEPWAAVVREGAGSGQAEATPNDLIKRIVEMTGTEFAPPGER